MAIASSSSSPPAALRVGWDDDALMEEVLRGFDPAHRLQELGVKWTTLQASVALFDKNSRLLVFVLVFFVAFLSYDFFWLLALLSGPFFFPLLL